MVGTFRFRNETILALVRTLWIDGLWLHALSMTRGRPIKNAPQWVLSGADEEELISQRVSAVDEAWGLLKANLQGVAGEFG